MKQSQATSYLKNLAGAFLVLSHITPAFAESASLEMNEDETKITRFMAQHDVPSFFLMDKKQGKLIAIRDGKIQKRFNALSGWKEGDNNDKGMTPAGIFPMELHKDIPSYGDVFVFNYKDQTDRYTSIHTVLNIPGEKRMERLKSPTAADNRISHDGCINISERDLKEIKELTPILPKTIRHDTGKVSSANSGFLVILPENQPVDAFFGITP